MASGYTLWFHPGCSKCREALTLLREHDVEPSLRVYVDEPPTVAELDTLLDQLAAPPIAIVRTKEERARGLGLSERTPRADLLAAVAKHPTLLERPILARGDRAVIARPAERVLELLDSIHSPERIDR